MRSRTAGVKTTLMRNGRDRRLGKPVRCHARKERVLLFGTQSADHIRASGQSGCIQRPDTWLHPNASLKRQIPLAPRAPSIHGTFETCGATPRYVWSSGWTGSGWPMVKPTRITLSGHHGSRRRMESACSTISRTISAADCGFDTRPTLCPAHSDMASMSPSASAPGV